MKSILSNAKRAWLDIWRVFPLSFLITGGFGLLMMDASESARMSPNYVYLGRLFVVAAVVTWLEGLWWSRRQPRPTTSLVGDAFLVAGKVPPWPTTRLLAPWMVGAILIQLCILVRSVEEIVHVDVLLGVEPEICDVNDARVDEDEDRLTVELRVLTQEGVQSGWLSIKDNIRTVAAGNDLIEERYRDGTELPCYRSGALPHHIEIELPDETELPIWVGIAIASLYTLCLLIVRQWRAWKYRGGRHDLSPSHLRPDSTALQAALMEIGPQIPAGFEVHTTRDGDVVIGFVRVGSEELDAFISVFNFLLSAGALVFPIVYWSQMGELHWSMVAILLCTVLIVGIVGIVGIVAYRNLPTFLRNCIGWTVLTFTDDELLVHRKVLGRSRILSCSRQTIQCVTQVQDVGEDSDSFAGWGLMVEAHEQLELLHREEPQRSRWLGSVIATWAAVPYHHAGPYRS